MYPLSDTGNSKLNKIDENGNTIKDSIESLLYTKIYIIV